MLFLKISFLRTLKLKCRDSIVLLAISLFWLRGISQKLVENEISILVIAKVLDSK